MTQRSTTRNSTLDEFIELLSSMRFAISLLTILAIASVIGTVVQQNMPANTYLNQFGQLWDPVFSRLGFYAVYNSAWFATILAFLVLSTTLCIIRQFTPMLREMRSFREHAREASLRHFSHHASLEPTLPPEERSDAVTKYLARAGFHFRVDQREDSTLIAAKQGSLGHVGYFLAHGAIVLICLGGLLDSSLPLSLQMRLNGKAPATDKKIKTINDVPPSAWLEPNSLSFRGNVRIPEGGTVGYALLNTDGVLIQSLPFKVKLNRFHLDHYENGMAKHFASDVVVTDIETGETFERTIEVNKPFEHRGITLYQASYEDGGSTLHFSAHDMTASAQPPTPLKTELGMRIPLTSTGNHTLEIGEFRSSNVEDFSDPDSKTDHPVFFGSAARTASNKNLRNLGPQYTYKLHGPNEQVREFINYMQPVQIGGFKYLISGVRTSQTEPPSWLRIPLDSEDSVDAWFSIHQIFFNSERHAALIERFISHAPNKDDRKSLKTIAGHLLALFARGGLDAVENFTKTIVPEEKEEAKRKEAEDKRNEAGAAFIQIFQGLVWEAWMMARETAGKDALELSDIHAAPFVRDAFIALNMSTQYGAPFYLQLTGYEHVTVLQATRSPGKPLVYLGSLLLALGVFAMLYIRERRLFVLFKKDEALVAMSSGRKTIDLDENFVRHRDGLAAVLGASAPQD